MPGLGLPHSFEGHPVACYVEAGRKFRGQCLLTGVQLVGMVASSFLFGRHDATSPIKES